MFVHHDCPKIFPLPLFKDWQRQGRETTGGTRTDPGLPFQPCAVTYWARALPLQHHPSGRGPTEPGPQQADAVHHAGHGHRGNIPRIQVQNHTLLQCIIKKTFTSPPFGFQLVHVCVYVYVCLHVICFHLLSSCCTSMTKFNKTCYFHTTCSTQIFSHRCNYYCWTCNVLYADLTMNDNK